MFPCAYFLNDFVVSRPFCRPPDSAAACPSRAVYLPTGEPLCPRYVLTRRGGTGQGHAASFGRLRPGHIVNVREGGVGEVLLF